MVMPDTSDGQELCISGELGMVFEEDTGITLVNAPCLNSSIIISEGSHLGGLGVSHYILPSDVTVAGFEEVVEEVKLEPSWDSLPSSTSNNSANQDSGIESDANTDVFFALVEDPSGPMTLLTAVSPMEKNGEILVEKRLLEMREDVILPQIEIKDDDSISEELIRIKNERYSTLGIMIKDEDNATDHREELICTDDDSLGSITIKIDPFRCSEPLNDDSLRISDTKILYHCSECDVAFRSQKIYKNHMEAHLVRLQNSCALCNKEFSSKAFLQEHIKDHFTRLATVECEVCNKEFSSKSLLRRHKKQHHSPPPVSISSVKCDICHAVFSSKFSLKSHLATHSSRKPFTCKECMATFTQNGSLQVHMRGHRGEKPFKCDTCGNNFTRAHSLKVHMKTHTGEKPYACEYCSARFVTSSHLIVHRRTHTGERPYSCHQCGSTFITTSHLNVHRRLHNANAIKSSTNSSNFCSPCGLYFDDLVKLRQHRRTEHKNCATKNKILIFREIDPPSNE